MQWFFLWELYNDFVWFMSFYFYNYYQHWCNLHVQITGLTQSILIRQTIPIDDSGTASGRQRMCHCAGLQVAAVLLLVGAASLPGCWSCHHVDVAAPCHRWAARTRRRGGRRRTHKRLEGMRSEGAVRTSPWQTDVLSIWLLALGSRLKAEWPRQALFS